MEIDKCEIEVSSSDGERTGHQCFCSDSESDNILLAKIALGEKKNIIPLKDKKTNILDLAEA